MSHARSGLPPLNLEPFDPAPLYAAARSHVRDKARPSHKAKRGRLLLALEAALVMALVLGGLAAFLLR